MKNEKEFIDYISTLDPKNKAELLSVEHKFNCKVKVTIEKHNALQFTYYYEVDFGKEELFYVEIENGINNGTRVNSAEWGINTFSSSKKELVCVDVVFSKEKFLQVFGDDKRINAARALFENNKERLMELHRKQRYDNYVTGGGTGVTKAHYNGEYELLEKRGVFYDYVYEEQEVDRTII